MKQINFKKIGNILVIITIITVTVAMTFLSVRYYDHRNTVRELSSLKEENTLLKNAQVELLTEQNQSNKEKILSMKAKYESDVPYVENEIPK